MFRLIPSEIKTVDELGLPPVVAELARFASWTGAGDRANRIGKSTTLAAMVNVVNEERAAHIMTVEDPIEFLHSETSARRSTSERWHEAIPTASRSR